jgi:hypothetical protein
MAEEEEEGEVEFHAVLGQFLADHKLRFLSGKRWLAASYFTLVPFMWREQMA